MITAYELKDLFQRISIHDDAIAYKQLFLSYQPKLVHFSNSITKCKESAEEVVSDVFVKVWNNRKSLENILNPHLYLYISTKNLSINCLEKQKRERAFLFDDVVVDFKSIYFSPEQLMITAEMFKRIRHAIQQLPPRCQLVFKLVKEDGLTYKETAELLELSVKTIENQMTIALKKIGKAIQFNPQKSTSI